METTKKDLEYYRKNAEEDYLITPISVLRYITEMEQALRIHDVGYCAASPEDIADNYYTAECSECGWWGSSKLLDGGGAIADTGDHFDCTCPVCGNSDIDERHYA